jgi:hypothetical protein
MGDDHNTRLVRKTYTPPPPPQAAATMTQAQSEGWNDWCLAIVRTELGATLDGFTDMLGEETARIAKAQNEKIRKLEEELAALRADVTIQHAATRGVVDLAKWRAPKAS